MSTPDSIGPKITVRLMGGLGNQLFQYAFGRNLALGNGARLVLDASGFAAAKRNSNHSARTCELSQFDIVGTVIGVDIPDRRQRISISRRVQKLARAVRALTESHKPYYQRHEIIEPVAQYFRFDARVRGLQLMDDVSIRGFWQSEKYFIGIEASLRKELTVSHPPDPVNSQLAGDMQATNSVAVHVRHGDNATPEAAALGVLPHEYYEAALLGIGREVREPHLFIFSDDVAWARLMLRSAFPTTIVDHNGIGRSHEDLRLMASCRHHVIANSTFGWWGAWLGRTGGQIVYAPRRYYQNIDRPNPDLYPAGWRLI